MEQLAAWLAGIGHVPLETSRKLVQTGVVVLVLWAIRALILRIVWARSDDAAARYGWRKVTGYVAVAIGSLAIARVWFAGFGSFATFAGLVSAGLAIALKDIVANLAGWVFLVWRRPFVVGDRIEVGGHQGDVIDVRAFQFSLMEVGNWVDADQSTGRVLHVPNGLVLTQTVANYSRGFPYIWNEIPVLITFESDWVRAKEILLEIVTNRPEALSERAEHALREASKAFFIRYPTLTPTVYTSVEESGVLLTLRYLCPPRRRRGTEQSIWEAILEAFAEEPRIDFAYPTTRFYGRAADEARRGNEGRSG
jgi:small-conductance mechanosensitive channel